NGLLEVGPVKVEGEFHLPVLPLARHRGVEHAGKAHTPFLAETYEVARVQALGRARECAPTALIDALVEIDADLGTRLPAKALPTQRGPYDARIVEHQRIARLEQLGEVAHSAILEPV